MVFAEDYILEHFWDGEYPVNILDIATALYICLSYTDDLEDPENNWEIHVKERHNFAKYIAMDSWDVYLNAQWWNSLSKYERREFVACLCQFRVRKIDPHCSKDVNMELWEKGIKIGRHILVPQDDIIKILSSKNNLKTMEDCINLVMKRYDVPRSVAISRLDKVNQKLQLR